MPGKVLYFMVLATVLALAVVWENAALRQAGYRLERVRTEVAEQRAERVTHQAHLSKLRNPQRILALVKWLGLDLHERSVPADDAAATQAAPGPHPTVPAGRPAPATASAGRTPPAPPARPAAEAGRTLAAVPRP